MKLRNENILEKHLQGSKCLFVFKKNQIKLPGDFNSNFNLKDLGYAKELSYSHSYGDAFTGIYYLSKLFRLCNQGQERCDENKINEDFSHENFRIKHLFRVSKNLIGSVSARSIIENCHEKSKFLNEFSHLSFVVRLEDVEQLSDLTMHGNSFLIIELESQKAYETAKKGATEWKLALNKKGRIVYEWLKKGKRLKTENLAPLLFSSLGDVSKLNYAHKDIRPSNLAMIPTPNDRRKAHIILWSSLNEHALTIVADPMHRIWETSKSLEEIWADLIVRKDVLKANGDHFEKITD